MSYHPRGSERLKSKRVDDCASTRHHSNHHQVSTQPAHSASGSALVSSSFSREVPVGRSIPLQSRTVCVRGYSSLRGEITRAEPESLFAK